MDLENAYITERCVNMHIYPVVGSKTKQLNTTYRIRDNTNLFEAECGSIWDYHCYKLMDVFSTEIRRKFLNQLYPFTNGKKISPTNIPQLVLLRQPEYINYINDLNDPSNNIIHTSYNIDLKFRIKHLKALPQFENTDSYTITKTLKRISNCNIRSTFEIKSIQPDNSLSFKFKHQNHSFEPICKIEKIDSEYVISFGPKISSLSTIFVHNIFTNGFIIIKNPSKFYNLSKLSNILVRLKCIGYSNIKLNLSMDHVCYLLGINNINVTEKRKKFISIIEEISESGFCKISKFYNDIYTIFI